MQAKQLLSKIGLTIEESQNFLVEGISDSSKNILQNYIFVAIQGITHNGNDYVKEAVENRAKLVITDQQNLEITANIPLIKVENARKILIKLLELFHPNKPENIVAVTGTNGKSSTVDFYRSIFELLGCKSASIGTIGIISEWIDFEPSFVHMTTPSLVNMHNILTQMKNKDITHVSLEASSHGLDQDRLGGIRFKAAAFTNLTPDHLDYHLSMENYLIAKMKLFDQLVDEAFVIYNNDMDENVKEKLKEVIEEKQLQFINFGKNPGSMLQIINIAKLAGKQIIEIKYQGQIYQKQLNLIAEFQIYNLLTAIGLALATGKKFEEIWEIIDKVKNVRGRMEQIIHPKLAANIYIDYAHTGEALENILRDVREYTTGKLKVLFGCGGQRDKNRRFSMGKAANDLADEVFITDDNPRYEDPAEIRKDIKDFCPKGQEIPNRGEAIEKAVRGLGADDTLIIAGKGHSTYELVKDKKYYFSDKEQVILAIEKIID